MDTNFPGRYDPSDGRRHRNQRLQQGASSRSSPAPIAKGGKKVRRKSYQPPGGRLVKAKNSTASPSCGEPGVPFGGKSSRSFHRRGGKKGHVEQKVEGALQYTGGRIRGMDARTAKKEKRTGKGHCVRGGSGVTKRGGEARCTEGTGACKRSWGPQDSRIRTSFAVGKMVGGWQR